MIDIIVNTSYANDGLLRVADAADAEIASDMAGIMNVSSGSRHAYWKSSTTGLSRIQYRNDNSSQSFTHFVGARCDLHVGKKLNLISWPYPSGASSIDKTWNTLLAGDLLGPGAQDLVYKFPTPLSAKRGVALEFETTAYSKQLSKCFFGNAFSIPKAESFSARPFLDKVQIKRNQYLVERECLMTTYLTAAEVTSLERLYRIREEPCFFYDTTGGVLTGSLWHVIVADIRVTAEFRDKHKVEISFFRMRYY